MKRSSVLLFSLLLPLDALARGGGGGSGGEGGFTGNHSSGMSSGVSISSGSFGDIGFILIVIIFAVAFAVIIKNIKLRRTENIVNKELAEASATDPTWEKSRLTERVSSLFLAYQEAWCKDDVTWIATLCTPDFAERTALKMDVLRNMKRKDVMSDTRISEIFIDAVHDNIDNTKDSFEACITTSARNTLINAVDDKPLFSDSSSFTEYWTFAREDNDWRIASIKQETEDLAKTYKQIEIFAGENNLYYEPDFGWLMLPTRGELFKKNKLGTSDINNHVIGKRRGKIIELYTMQAYEKSDMWLIAQAILPINHFDILVRPKKFFQITPGSMRHRQTESNAFDKVFTLDSDGRDNVTTFELLTPDFMQYMLEFPSEITIEVVGNTLYFATRDIEHADYNNMLDLLDRAFDTMKL